MTSQQRPAALRLLSLLTLLAMLMLISPSSQAQTFTVLHTFTGGQDGGHPFGGLTEDSGGNFYGTTSLGGVGYGTVYKLALKGSNWTVDPLYEFSGGSDGSGPQAGVVFGPHGTLYGTTQLGGSAGLGTVFELRPPGAVCRAVLCYWDESVLHSFTAGSDGLGPAYATLTFDHAGNIYGTTGDGGEGGAGIAFELTESAGGWAESILKDFSLGAGGAYPLGGVIFDASGNLYGSTQEGGDGFGVVYQLVPMLNGFWAENVPLDFDQTNGSYPFGNLIMDPSGNLYGSTGGDGSSGGGTIFELTPSNGQWISSVLYNLSGNEGPVAGLSMDTGGNLYGTTYKDGADNAGMVFKLTNSNGVWTLHDLHDFTGGSDGGNPFSSVTIDASGKLYGTALVGGNTKDCNDVGCGVVWEITP